MGIHAVIIYYTLSLSICIIVFMGIVYIIVFMWIVSFKIIISMKRGILRFVSMLFLIFEKGDEQRNCARYFEICKYAFFNIWKGDEQKKQTVPGILKFISMLF